ncbi:MAG: hypothetical protein WDW38_008864 [Sanguina aurantia]
MESIILDDGGSSVAAPVGLQEVKQKHAGAAFARRFARDTAGFLAASYIMDTVDEGLKMLRGGQDDVINKMSGGTAAGAVLAYVWYPGRLEQRSRSNIIAGGAFVGYLSFIINRKSTQLLLQQQHQLESELLHKAPEEHKKELNMHYLRRLMEIKQKELVNARMGEIKEQQGKAAQPLGQASFASGGREAEPAPLPQPLGSAGFMDDFNARENNVSGAGGSSYNSSSSNDNGTSSGSGSGSSGGGSSVGSFGERARGSRVPNSYIPMPTRGSSEQGTADAGWLQLDADDSNKSSDSASGSSSSWK